MSCRFIVMSDTHFTAPPSTREETWWNRSTEGLSDKMGEALVGLVNELSPDFVIHCGDFIGECSRESFEFGAAVMNRLACPWYAVPGNHDTWCMDIRDCFKETFNTVGNTCSYTRELGGMCFFFLDMTHWFGYDGSISPVLDREAYNSGKIKSIGPLESDLRLLEDELERTTFPSVLVSHAPVAFRKAYPAVTLPHGRPVKGAMTPPEEFIPDFVGRERLLKITREHSSLKACFAGHWHLNDVVNDGGVWYVMTGALREFPYDIRLVEYTDETFMISTHRLDVPELMELSYVREWGNMWVEGGEDVRTVTCSFR